MEALLYLILTQKTKWSEQVFRQKYLSARDEYLSGALFYFGLAGGMFLVGPIVAAFVQWHIGSTKTSFLVWMVVMIGTPLVLLVANHVAAVAARKKFDKH